MRKFLKPFPALVVLLALAMPATEASAQSTPAAPGNKQFVYVLRLPARLHDPKAWTERDNAAVGEHFKRLQAATAQGKVILAGRTEEPLASTFGLVVFEAPDAEAARVFMQEDPAVAAGVMLASLHPYALALLRK